METQSNSKEEKVIKIVSKVKDVVFKTNDYGNINPVLKLYPNDDIKKLGLNAIVLESIEKYKETGVTKRSSITASFFEDGRLKSIDFITKASSGCTKFQVLPVNCATCENKLVEEAKHLKCTNKYCPATSQGFLYCMIKNITGRPTKTIEKFVDNYAVGESFAKIETMDEFKIVFQSVKGKDTASREKKWKDKFGDTSGLALYDLENEVEDYLKRDTLPNTLFWNTINFPKLNSGVYESLYKIDPKAFLSLNYNLGNLPRKLIKYLDVNLTAIMFFVKFFDSFGEKKWQKL